MAKLKMVKTPKRPKASASVETKQNYLKRLAEVKKENNKRKVLNAKSIALDKKIDSALRGCK